MVSDDLSSGLDHQWDNMRGSSSGDTIMVADEVSDNASLDTMFGRYKLGVIL